MTENQNNKIKSTGAGSAFRLEEIIWGHRLHDEQSGPMIALEFLNVLSNLSFKQFEKKSKQIVSDERPLGKILQYSSFRRLPLRTLIFNNPYLEHINIDNDHNDPWNVWQSYYYQQSIDPKPGTNYYYLSEFQHVQGPWSIEYLKTAFSQNGQLSSSESFRNFVSAIKLLRSSAFNIQSNKRWTSHFLFPWGKDCLFAEIDSKGSSDKRFFGRSGELLYILLSYADRKEQLEDLITKKYLSTNHDLNEVCKILQGPSLKKPNPYIEDYTSFINEKPLSNKGAEGPILVTAALKRRSNLLCDDLISILSSSLPPEDLFTHFWRIIGLHLICYLYERAVEASSDQFYSELPSGAEIVNEIDLLESFYFLCEIKAPRMTNIRHISQKNYTDNKSITTKAILTYISKFCDKEKRSLTDLSTDSNTPPLETFLSALKKEFSINEKPMKEIAAGANIDNIEDIFTKMAKRRHTGHWGNVHHEYSKSIGLSSTTGSLSYRYCPTDDFIVTLILANVHSDRLLINDFLENLYTKYHLVIGFNGPKSLRTQLNDSDFKENIDRFKVRLKSLGMLDYLSDGYEFVNNSFHTKAI